LISEEELDELAVEGQLKGDEEDNMDNPEGEGYSRDTGNKEYEAFDLQKVGSGRTKRALPLLLFVQ